MATIVSSALFAACTPSAPPATSPTPMPSATSATPTETEFQRQERVAYEGAEAAYRAFEAEYLREISSTYEPRVTQRMRAVAGGPFLKDSKRFLDNRRANKVRSKGKSHIKSILPVAYAIDRVELSICEDASAVTVFNKKREQLGRGIIATSDVTVRLTQNRWKVWSDSHQREVKSCES